MKGLIAALAIYLTGFLTAYGHAYNHRPDNFEGAKAAESFVIALFWPLYLSVKVFEKGGAA